MRIFCFTSADADRAVAQPALDDLVAVLRSVTQDTSPLEVTWSVDHFNANFARCGGWDAWSRSIPRERDRFQRPAFEHFVALTDFGTGRFGKATAMALTEALAMGRRVHWAALDNSHGALFCREVRQVEENDFRYGWVLL